MLTEQRKEKMKAYYRSSPEVTARIKARARAHYQANREKQIELAKAWQRDNAERKREIQRKSDAKHASKRAPVRAAWWAAHPEKREEYKGNIDPVLERIRCANRRARIKQVGGTLSPNIVDRLTAAQGGKCACCRTRLTKANRHLDHIQPLARGGPNIDANCQMLCASCNCSKRHRDPIEFMQSRGFLL